MTLVSHSNGTTASANLSWPLDRKQSAKSWSKQLLTMLDTCNYPRGIGQPG